MLQTFFRKYICSTKALEKDMPGCQVDSLVVPVAADQHSFCVSAVVIRYVFDSINKCQVLKNLDASGDTRKSLSIRKSGHKLFCGKDLVDSTAHKHSPNTV